MSMRWGVLATIPLTFWVTLALMPPELAQIDEKHVLWQASSYGAIEIARNLMRDSHPHFITGWSIYGGRSAALIAPMPIGCFLFCWV
jgi:hypothetical protein